jgi:alpha-L-rhamnosidase
MGMTYKTTRLRCEYLETPLAVESAQPRLSWEGDCPRPGAAQSAYRILVANSPATLGKHRGNLWDSGRVESNQSLHVRYAGKKLKSCQQVFWKVMAWDETGKAGPWSRPTSWTMGILCAKEWKAGWIGNYLGNHNTCPLLRKEFKCNGTPQRVLLYASALGLYHLTVNGKAVGDDVLAPGWTDYKKRCLYRAYDVTCLVKAKKLNCIGAELAEGWYKGAIGWSGHSNHYGSHLALMAQMRIEYVDGKTETVSTDTSWRSTFGGTLQSSIYHGETVDAQLTPTGWDTPGFDDTQWSQAIAVIPPECAKNRQAPLESYPAEPVRRTEERKPVDMWTVAPGKVIYDFGQNFAGRVRLSVPGKAGAVIRMRFGEVVNLDKTLYVDNLRSALASDTYVMKGKKNEVWEPKFTFHGFRYAEVSGLPVKPNREHATAVVIGSDTTRVGDFSCSLPLVNQIYQNAVWTQRANFLEVPTDCPQRDERLGWTGDAQVFVRTAICNMDVAAFFTKWTNDLLDAQHENGAFPNVAPDVLDSQGDAAWGDAGVVCPWTLYQCYEDQELLAKTYPAMQRWVAHLKKTSRRLLRHPDKVLCVGDWLSIKADTPKEVIQTAHFAYAVDIVRKAAEALGRKDDATRYGKLFKDVGKAFNQAFVKRDGRIHGETQTAYLMALKFGLLSPAKARQAVKHLVADIRRKKHHISTGFIGTALILSVLRDTGHLDLAYRLLENTTFPSWGYSVVNGATTIWERWNSWTNEGGPGDVHMNSYSHYAYGAVVEWMFNTIAGIDHNGQGFQHFVLAPRPGGSLKHAAATHHSPYGLIESRWRRRGKGYTYEVTIPANTCATVSLPVKDLSQVKLDGKRLDRHASAAAIDGQQFILPAGQYRMDF